MTVSQKRYDDEFKRNCVEMLLSGGRQLKPLARELGIKDSTLRGWRDGYLCRMDRPDGVAPAGATPREMAEEIRRLRKDLDRVTRQREILKKALGILTDQSPAGMP